MCNYETAYTTEYHVIIDSYGPLQTIIHNCYSHGYVMRCGCLARFFLFSIVNQNILTYEGFEPATFENEVELGPITP